MDLKLSNQLKFGKTNDGRIGAQIKPTGKNPHNKAWLTVVMRKTKDSNEIDEFYCYEVEYLELDENYSEEIYGLDYDLFYVKKETYFNIKNEKELANVLSAWLTDVNALKPVAQINHPYL